MLSTNVFIAIAMTSVTLAGQLPSIDLPTEDAKIQGKGISKQGTYMMKIREWSSTESNISWKVNFKAKGTVNVWVNQSSDNLSAGGTYTVSLGSQVLDAKVQNTGNWHTFKSINLGKLEIKEPGLHTIVLKATNIPKENLMHFDKVTLKGEPAQDASRTAYQLAPIARTDGFKLPLDQKIEHNTLTDFEKEAGWQLLFDGTSTNGWTGYRSLKIPNRWSVKNGNLSYSPNEEKVRGTLITQKKFSDFEFSCEWNISEGGDSGIFLRFNESKHNPHEQFPEYQIFDNTSIPDGLKLQRAAGASYDLFPAKLKAFLGPKKWNHTRILINGDKVEFFLNDIKTADFSLNASNYKKLVSNSKFHRWGDFGKLKEGHIGLQDYHSAIKFRNIKIRPIAIKKEK